MNNIEYNIPIQIVQIPFSTPNSNFINPMEITIGRNADFTEINRMYIQCDFSQIPKNSIIVQAAINIPVIRTTDDDNDNDANMMGFLVTSKVGNLDTVVWNNMPSFNLSASFFNRDIHGNSIISIDILNFVVGFLNGSIENNGFIFINKETTHNEAILDGNMLELTGVKIIVKLYDPNEGFIEKNLNINVPQSNYYTENILASYIEDGSIFVKNLDVNPISVTLEVSGNGIDFVQDNIYSPINYNETKIIIPYYWGKYVRLRIVSTGMVINSNIILQGHLI